MTLLGIYTIKIFIQFHQDKYIKFFYASKERDEVKNGGKEEKWKIRRQINVSKAVLLFRVL